MTGPARYLAGTFWLVVVLLLWPAAVLGGPGRDDTVNDDANDRTFCKKACDEEGVTACCELYGDWCSTGKGGPRDLKEAREYFQKSCDRSFTSKCVKLAEMLHDGVGGPRDLATARLLYQKACEREDARACMRFAVMLADAIGGARDTKGAVVIFANACDKGDLTACERAIKNDKENEENYREKACRLGAKKYCAAQLIYYSEKSSCRAENSCGFVQELFDAGGTSCEERRGKQLTAGGETVAVGFWYFANDAVGT